MIKKNNMYIYRNLFQNFFFFFFFGGCEFISYLLNHLFHILTKQ